MLGIGISPYPKHLINKFVLFWLVSSWGNSYTSCAQEWVSAFTNHKKTWNVVGNTTGQTLVIILDCALMWKTTEGLASTTLILLQLGHIATEQGSVLLPACGHISWEKFRNRTLLTNFSSHHPSTEKGSSFREKSPKCTFPFPRAP